MEIYISNLDARTTKDQLTHSLNPLLQKLHIDVFDLRKRTDKGHAQLTILDVQKAQQLLAHAAQQPRLFVSQSGRLANFAVSRYAPDAQLLRVLQKEAKDLKSRQAWQKLAKPGSKLEVKRVPQRDERNTLTFLSVEVGRWETASGSTTFVPYYRSDHGGSLTATNQALVVKINSDAGVRHDLVMDFFSILSISLSRIAGKRTLTLALELAPKVFQDEARTSIEDLPDLFALLNSSVIERHRVTRFRETSLPNMSSAIMGTCLTYRLTFEEDMTQFKQCVQRMTSYQIHISRTHDIQAQPTVADHATHVSQLNANVARTRCSFRWSYQIHALWASSILSPQEVSHLLPVMKAIHKRAGEGALIQVLSRTLLQLDHIDASTNASTGGGLRSAVDILLQQEKFVLQDEEVVKVMQDEVFVHRALVTPAGVYLSGPEPTAANRILRQYRAHQDCFLRVVFADENEDRVQFDRDISNERVFQGKFLNTLRKGLDIAGQHFDFLGFSHSSLRSSTCWFMRPFVHNGTLMFAKSLISQIGDFSQIRCPAKCAARIGQAFSESTSAVKIDPATVSVNRDVEIGGHTFTDGCGTISPATWRLLKGNHSSKDQPTSYQIRYKGAKGMLTLDSSLSGYQMRLRDSMVKFKGSPSDDLEICGTNARPLPFKLNRQVIKILEDLDIPASVFEDLQEQAIQDLRRSARSPDSAIDFISKEMSDTSSNLPKLLRCLQKIRIDISGDSFLRDILGALLQVQLRDIKYRSRILVPKAVTLYGISDETRWLQEGQVFVTHINETTKQKVCLTGTVAVTRSPALHPGDVQVVEAVSPPQGSPLRKLRNCVVFSQHGKRDLPSMLSGGDLDGDLYNIIIDERLVPKKTYNPADYTPAKPVDIGREVTADDMTGFFVDFMENDQLGRIATLHQVFADSKGTKSAECLLLAELHSTAVDFSKSGVPVDVKKIPRAPPYRPDFMAPSASTKVEKGISRSELTALAAPQGNQRYRYYESDRVLGKLYRAIDEDIFFTELEDDTSSMFSTDPADAVLAEILEWVEGYIDPKQVMLLKDLAKEVRDSYESNMLQIMSRYAIHRTDRLTEKEVFIGTILGRSGAGSRYQKEQSHNMKAAFNVELREIKDWMKTHTEKYGEYGYLHLSAACLWHAVNVESEVDKNLLSFGWFAAALCVPPLLGQVEEEMSEW